MFAQEHFITMFGFEDYLVVLKASSFNIDGKRPKAEF